MWRDPEAEAVASTAAWRAHKSYDGRIPWKSWVARNVKLDIWYTWRNQKYKKSMEKLAAEEWWLGVEVEHVPSEHEAISDEAWQMLVEHYVDGWPLDVIAKKHSMKYACVQLMMKFASELLDTASRSVAY